MDIKTTLFSSAAVCLGGIVLTALTPLGLPLAAIALGVLLKYALTAAENSMIDTLTGLFNLRHLEFCRKKYQKADQVGVLYLDVDDLKVINDTWGHDAGDKALRGASGAMLQISGAQAYRVGGDEFLMLSVSLSARSLMEQWVELQKEVSVSVGSAQGPGSELSELIRSAEQDMYCRKQAGKQKLRD